MSINFLIEFTFWLQKTNNINQLRSIIAHVYYYDMRFDKCNEFVFVLQNIYNSRIVLK